MSSKIEKSLIVIKQMLKDRKFDLISEDINDKNVILVSQNELNNKSIVYYINDKKNMSKKSFGNIITSLQKTYDLTNDDKIIFILNFLDESFKLDIPAKYKDYENHMIQIFNIKRLLINITKHSLSPEYQKLNDEQISLLKEDYKLDNLAKISVDDPICKYLDLKIDDVLKIIRNSNNSYKYITYRIVIKK